MAIKKKQKVQKKEVKSTSQNNLQAMRFMMDEIMSTQKDLIVMSEKAELRFVPTAFSSLNRAFKVGGIPTGGIVTVHGPTHGGKTALCAGIMAEAQRLGHLTLFCDGERAANDIHWLSAMGFNVNNSMYFNPESFEHASEKINNAIIKFKDMRADALKELNKTRISDEDREKYQSIADTMFLILIDSVPTLVPKDVIKAGVGKANFGATARFMSDWLPQLVTLVGDGNGTNSNITVMFITQERPNIGGMPWEPKYKLNGGEALPYYSLARIRVRRKSEIKEQINGTEEVVGSEHEFKIEKCKVGSSTGERGSFFLSNGKSPDVPIGFDYAQEVFREAFINDVIIKPNSVMYSCEFFDKDLRGENATIQYLRENPKIVEEIKEKLREQVQEKLTGG